VSTYSIFERTDCVGCFFSKMGAGFRGVYRLFEMSNQDDLQLLQGSKLWGLTQTSRKLTVGLTDFLRSKHWTPSPHLRTRTAVRPQRLTAGLGSLDAGNQRDSRQVCKSWISLQGSIAGVVCERTDVLLVLLMLRMSRLLSSNCQTLLALAGRIFTES
jgi:hypothetical protein